MPSPQHYLPLTSPKSTPDTKPQVSLTNADSDVSSRYLSAKRKFSAIDTPHVVASKVKKADIPGSTIKTLSPQSSILASKASDKPSAQPCVQFDSQLPATKLGAGSQISATPRSQAVDAKKPPQGLKEQSSKSAGRSSQSYSSAHPKANIKASSSTSRPSKASSPSTRRSTSARTDKAKSKPSLSSAKQAACTTNNSKSKTQAGTTAEPKKPCLLACCQVKKPSTENCLIVNGRRWPMPPVIKSSSQVSQASRQQPAPTLAQGTSRNPAPGGVKATTLVSQAKGTRAKTTARHSLQAPSRATNLPVVMSLDADCLVTQSGSTIQYNSSGN